MIINCIAVDDEPLALGLVCKFIGQTPFLKLVGRYATAVEALKSIHAKHIDVIFLDIQMSDLNGIELARVLGKGPDSPLIIFTTAYNQFALEGYKLDVVDYLLKPFNYEEFLRAATKAFNRIASRAKPVPESVTPEAAGQPDKADEEFLFLKVEYQLVRIALDDILYIEGVKDYIKVYRKASDKPLMSLNSLKALEKRLPQKRFMRVHRSYIVALGQITSMTRNSVQIGKTVITVGDQYKAAFAKFVGKWI